MWLKGVCYERHLYYSHHLGNSKDFRSSVPGTRMKTKCILLFINHTLFCTPCWARGRWESQGKKTSLRTSDLSEALTLLSKPASKFWLHREAVILPLSCLCFGSLSSPPMIMWQQIFLKVRRWTWLSSLHFLSPVNCLSTEQICSWSSGLKYQWNF